jgi:hypothetical protein
MQLAYPSKRATIINLLSQAFNIAVGRTKQSTERPELIHLSDEEQEHWRTELAKVQDVLKREAEELTELYCAPSGARCTQKCMHFDKGRAFVQESGGRFILISYAPRCKLCNT